MPHRSSTDKPCSHTAQFIEGISAIWRRLIRGGSDISQAFVGQLSTGRPSVQVIESGPEKLPRNCLSHLKSLPLLISGHCREYPDTGFHACNCQGSAVCIQLFHNIVGVRSVNPSQNGLIKPV
jgi:hypothetical protein